MIVGTKDVEAYEVAQHCQDVNTLRSYCDSLVPRVLRHNQKIINNQRYLIALVVRGVKSIPYSQRKKLYEGLLEGVSITGLANKIYDYDDIILSIDVDMLAQFINRGGLHNE
ncbi:MAG: hypothetical protein NC131_16980 [Roseburia sp.]|nr:hypothetical protein [Roseburia sp.]